MDHKLSDLASLQSAFNRTLDEHGYSFQYAVAKEFERLWSESCSPWRLPTIEFPVEVKGKATRIDLILEHRRLGIWLVCECKRVNPAFGDWCFIRAPFTDRGELAGQVYSECIVWSRNDSRPVASANPLYSSDRIYHLGIEVKGAQQGDRQGKGPGGIEDALTQVLRGLNGLVEFLGRSERATEELKVINLLPVVITTANLWVTTADIAQADLATGQLQLPDTCLEKTDWIWYHYPQSPGLKQAFVAEALHSSGDLLTQALYGSFVRPVAIVNASCLASFCGNGHLFH